MATKRDKPPEMFDTVETVGFLAEEDQQDRRMLWRLGSWGVCAVGAVTLAVFVSQSAVEQRRATLANAADSIRQTQQLQSLIAENQSEASRLALSIETLNNDRDRLYSRVSTLEQGLDSVTGTVNRRVAAAVTASAPQPDKPALSRPETIATPVEPSTGPTSPLMPARSLMSPPDPAASKLSETAPQSSEVPKPDARPEVTAAISTDADLAATPSAPPSLGVDLGGAPTLEGLRALWRQRLKAHVEVIGLQPLMAVREQPGSAGVQFRLIAGPLNEAAATQVCASLGAALCQPAAYDGQRLALTSPVRLRFRTRVASRFHGRSAPQRTQPWPRRLPRAELPGTAPACLGQQTLA